MHDEIFHVTFPFIIVRASKGYTAILKLANKYLEIVHEIMKTYLVWMRKRCRNWRTKYPDSYKLKYFRIIGRFLITTRISKHSTVTSDGR